MDILQSLNTLNSVSPHFTVEALPSVASPFFPHVRTLLNVQAVSVEPNVPP